MAAIQVGGLGSGIDVNGLLVQLRQAEEMKLQPISTERTNNDGKISAFGSLKSTLTRLQDAVQELNKSKSFKPLTSSISGSGVAIIAGDNALEGSHSVKVNQLARSQMLSTAGVIDKSQALTGAGTLSLQSGSDEAVSIDIAEGSTLEQIRNAINLAGAGVTASIINTGDEAAPFRLMIASDTTGSQSAVDMSFSGTGELQSLLNDASNGGTMEEVRSAANAELTVNGMTIVSQTNTIKDAIQGVTMNITEVGSEQQLSVVKDEAAIKKSITNFVDAYNSYISVTKSLTVFNEDPKLSGKLLGDSTLRGIQGKITSVMSKPEEDSTYRVMAQFGVNLTKDGTLEINSSLLDEKIATDSEGVAGFFVGNSYETGFAGRLNQQLEAALRFEGTLEIATEGLKSRTSQINERLEKGIERIDVVIERYRVQFAQMDAMVGQMNSMMSYLTQQFDAMNAQLGRK